MKLVYWIDKPSGHPLHKIAKGLGFFRSGWVRPNKYLHHGTGKIDRLDLEAEYTELDYMLLDGIPLIPNLEHFTWILNDGSGPLSAYDWLQRHRCVALFMRSRFVNRLVGEWGLRIGSNADLNALYAEWTCGVLSIYRRAGETDLSWTARVTGRYHQTYNVGKPIQLDMAPVIWQRGGAPRSDARAATDREWRQMLKVAEKLDPRWAGFWLRDGVQGVTDEYIEKAMGEMADKLG